MPSGVWDADEYRKLPAYDLETPLQPSALFYCHQRNQRLCAGWVDVHDMEENLAVRLAAAFGTLDETALAAVHRYKTDVATFESGRQACEHGTAQIEDPSPQARATISKLVRTGKTGRAAP